MLFTKVKAHKYACGYFSSLIIETEDPTCLVSFFFSRAVKYFIQVHILTAEQPAGSQVL